MPEYTDLAGVPIPLRTEVDDISAILKACFEKIDSYYVLRAKNVADLAQYGNVPIGTIVTGTEQKAIWRKETAGWSTIWSDSGWQYPTMINGQYISSASRLGWRRIGDIVSWRGNYQTPADYQPEDSWITVSSLPAEAVSVQNLRMPALNGGGVTGLWRTYEGALQFSADAVTTSFFSAPSTYFAA